MTTPHFRTSIGRSPWRRAFLLIPILSACFAFSPTARALLPPPPPDGGYPGNNTAEGFDALFSLTTGIHNTAIGSAALSDNTTGNYNTAIGSSALIYNRTGSHNTATGAVALFYNTTGSYNTANGSYTLSSNTTGYDNTASGAYTLSSNTIGYYNTAGGYAALYNNTTGYDNTASGLEALFHNTTGHDNTATGFQALRQNTTGSNNMANGVQALYYNTTGYQNTANGFQALVSNTSGRNNTANGVQALFRNTTGASNAANGFQALAINTIGNNNTANGVQALQSNTGSSNIGLGYNAGSSLTTGSGNVCIGAGILGLPGESNTTRIRNIYSSVASGRTVYVNSDNKIGTLASTRRVKNDIKPMDRVSEAVLALKPVSFRYKKEIDASGTLQFGLVAEEVADINADLVTRDSGVKPETVRYEAVNAMLLNEFLKEHRNNEEQARDIEEQKATIALQQRQIDALTTGLQKVSAQLEASRPAPQVVNNP